MNKSKGFTLAEVLVTLTIIGVIAAVLFPSVLASYNEKTLKAKRQAFVARMSQAMGELADQFANYEAVGDREKTAEDADTYTPNCTTNPLDCADGGSTLKFINEGLSRIYKIAAVCDNETLSACDIPDEITRADGSTFNLYDKKTWKDYNEQLIVGKDRNNLYGILYNTDSAAFMTKNGESALIYYNPECTGRMDRVATFNNAESSVCLNIIYDLNGAKKKPNRIGEDVGVLTVLYSNAPNVVAPRIFDMSRTPEFSNISTTTSPEYEENAMSFDDARSFCHAFGDNISLPTKEEALSIMLNYDLFNDRDRDDMPKHTVFWTGTMASTTQAWTGKICQKDGSAGILDASISPPEGSSDCWGLSLSYANKTTTEATVKCVYTD